jgi:hypothetical protein
MGNGSSGAMDDAAGPLEPPSAAVFFSPVLSRGLRLGVRTGVLAAAATAGAIIGLGLRHGAALDPFTLTGRSLVGAAPVLVATIAGLSLHVGWMLVWGACFTLVAASLRGTRLLLAAIFFAIALWGLSSYLMPSAEPATRAAGLTTPQSLFVHLLLALGLASGMRLAQEHP